MGDQNDLHLAHVGMHAKTDICHEISLEVDYNTLKMERTATATIGNPTMEMNS